ncbi:hypothetical protein, partial [Rhizobium leguminosarum]|uniref:hypothetical protein n=1 Tax=Rhizobium leguminosarum TaxID=384 RepID=UPI001953F2CD
ESNHDLPRLENPQTSNHFSKRAVMHTSMTAHQNAAMDFAPRTSPHIKVWLAERQHRAVGLRQQATLAKAEAVRPLNAKYFDSAIDTFRNELSRDTQRLF